MTGEKKAKILVVDDEPGIVNVVKQWLERHHYEVITASSGQDGLGKAYAEKPDLILLDIMMPGIDGYTAALQLSREPWARVVILSGADERYLGGVFKDKVDGWVHKPFTLDALLREVEQTLRRSKGV